MKYHELFVNIQQLSLSVAGLSGSLLNHLISWSFKNNLNIMARNFRLTVHEFHERLICCSGTFVNSS